MIFLHLGFNNTATTFLQNFFFDKHPNIKNLGKPNFFFGKLKQFRISLKEHMITGKKFEDKASIMLFKKIIKENKICIFSDENLHIKVKAQKIFNVFKSIHRKSIILFTIREQMNLIESLYFKDIKMQKISPNYPIDLWVIKNKDYLLTKINYSKQIQEFEKYFGIKNIRVLVYEEFTNDIKSFSRNLSNILGVSNKTSVDLLSKHIKIKPRVRLSRRKLILKKNFGLYYKYLAKLFGKYKLIRKWVDGGIEGKIELNFNENDHKKFKETIVRCNKSISKKYSVDLGKFGYLI